MCLFSIFLILFYDYNIKLIQLYNKLIYLYTLRKIQIDDVIQKRYKPPLPKIHQFKGKLEQNKESTISSDFIVKLAKNGVGFAIVRKIDETIL